MEKWESESQFVESFHWIVATDTQSNRGCLMNILEEMYMHDVKIRLEREKEKNPKRFPVILSELCGLSPKRVKKCKIKEKEFTSVKIYYAEERARRS